MFLNPHFLCNGKPKWLSSFLNIIFKTNEWISQWLSYHILLHQPVSKTFNIHSRIEWVKYWRTCHWTACKIWISNSVCLCNVYIDQQWPPPFLSMHYVSPLAYKTRCNARGYAPQPSKPSTHCQQFAPLFNSVTKFKAITYVSFIYRPLRGQCSVHKRTHSLVLNIAATASNVCQQNAYVWNIVKFAKRGKYIQTWHTLSF